MDILSYNRHAWDAQVARGNRWTLMVDGETIRRARQGEWQVVLTPSKPIPSDWYPNLCGCDLLCLAGGGGQQAPILAAAGARVTVFDNSPAQLDQDRAVAEREGLELVTVQGDMADLSCFVDSSFDLIVHPCSNSFVPDVFPVWREAFRVLRLGGLLLSGMCSPFIFTFDPELIAKGIFQLKYSIPYSDLNLTSEQRERFFGKDEPLSFGHSLEDQIGGQTRAGFHITGFYDDYWDEVQSLDKFIPGFFATRALKPQV